MDWPSEFQNEAFVSHVIEAGKSTEIAPIHVLPTSPERYFTLGFVEYETVAGLRCRTHFCYLVAQVRHKDGVVRTRGDFAEIRRYPSHPDDT